LVALGRSSLRFDSLPSSLSGSVGGIHPPPFPGKPRLTRQISNARTTLSTCSCGVRPVVNISSRSRNHGSSLLWPYACVHARAMCVCACARACARARVCVPSTAGGSGGAELASLQRAPPHAPAADTPLTYSPAPTKAVRALIRMAAADTAAGATRDAATTRNRGWVSHALLPSAFVSLPPGSLSARARQRGHLLTQRTSRSMPTGANVLLSLLLLHCLWVRCADQRIPGAWRKDVEKKSTIYQ